MRLVRLDGVKELVSRARHTLPPLYRQINREDRLVFTVSVGARDTNSYLPKLRTVYHPL